MNAPGEPGRCRRDLYPFETSPLKIYVMKPDGSDVTLVANTEGRATAPVWSPDGATIYFPICRNVDLGHDCQIFAAPAPRARS